MRSKLAMKNLTANLILQVVVFISGIILPKFFLEAYGSSVNGMVTSINQFLTYLGLAEAGVGTASVVALYAPLAEGRQKDTNEILSATRLFYYRSGSIFLALVLMLTWIYPYLISQQLPSDTVRMMVLVLASSTLVDYLFLGKYKVILTAMQKGYVIAIAQIVGTIVNMGVSIFLIYMHVDVVMVKAVATGAYILRFFVIRWYVKKNHPELDFKTTPDFTALNQRGAALLHQVVGIIVNNTDVVILTIMLGSSSLKEVSVYGIYNLIVCAVFTLLNVFANGLTAGFGEVISKKEDAVLEKAFSSFEYLYFLVFSIICICVGTLILPFVSVYTNNVTDAVYVRPLIAALFVIIVYFQNIRLPGQTIICAAGHFKETQPQAIREAVINLTVSLLLVKRFGMAGVLAGTICSYGYRSIEIMVYNQKNIVKGSGKRTFSRVIRNLIVTCMIGIPAVYMIPVNMTSYLQWFLTAFVVGIVGSIGIIMINLICEPQEFKNLFDRVKGIVKR